MNDSLRPDIHIRSGSHLSVLGYTKSIKPFPIVLFRIIRNDHTIGDHNPGSIFMRRKQSQRMTGIHHQSLFVGHFWQIFHSQTILCPVLEYRTVSSVSNQLMGMLCNSLIQIIVDHQHNSSCLQTFMRIIVYIMSVHFIIRPEPIHINPAIFF